MLVEFPTLGKKIKGALHVFFFFFFNDKINANTPVLDKPPQVMSEPIPLHAEVVQR